MPRRVAHCESIRIPRGGSWGGLVFAACMLLALLVYPLARADSILLRSGERLIGKVLTEQPDRVRFESQALGVLEIPRDRVERIERDAPPPPAVTAGQAATTTPTLAEKDSIVPAAPASAADQPQPVVVEQAPVAPAVVAPATPPAVVPAAVPVVAPVVAPETAPVTVQYVAVTPAAPSAVPVFYPWSGLRTEQDTYDWIQLKSGEWLKGKLKGMQNYELDFDSDKLNLLTFEWKDVAIVRSPRLNSVWFGEEGTAAGSLLVADGVVKVISAAGTTTFSREDLLAITPTGIRERNNWTGKLMFGLNLRSGNTEEKSYNVNATVQRRTPLTRLKLDYLGNYSYTNGVTNEENIRSSAQFDYFFSRKLYVRIPDLEYYRDPLQNIEGRLTAGGAAGYEFYRTPNFEWDATAGPAYSSTKYLSVEAGKNQTEKTVAAILGTHLDWQLTNKLEWIFDYRAQASGKKSSGGTTQHLNSTLEFEIRKRLKLDLTFTWDRVGDPKPNENGTLPLPNDYRLSTSLGVDF